MTNAEMYAKHLAKIANGSPLALAFDRSMAGTASAEDLFDCIDWELWECIMSLPPLAGTLSTKQLGGDLTKVTDEWHASACASRVECNVRRLKKLLAEEKAR